MGASVGLPGNLVVSRETSERLAAFLGLVERWNRTINLVAPLSLSDGWTRHVVDSAQLYPIARQGVRRWVDIGSGGGFPGIVIAVLGHEKAPGMTVGLVESDRRKAAFLREAVRQLGLRAEVFDERAEAVPPQRAEVVSARALAPLPSLLALVRRHMDEGGEALLLKGRGVQGEIEAATSSWTFRHDLFQSCTGAGGHIVRIRELQHVDG